MSCDMYCFPEEMNNLEQSTNQSTQESKAWRGTCTEHPEEGIDHPSGEVSDNQQRQPKEQRNWIDIGAGTASRFVDWLSSSTSAFRPEAETEGFSIALYAEYEVSDVVSKMRTKISEVEANASNEVWEYAKQIEKRLSRVEVDVRGLKEGIELQMALQADASESMINEALERMSDDLQQKSKESLQELVQDVTSKARSMCDEAAAEEKQFEFQMMNELEDVGETIAELEERSEYKRRKQAKQATAKWENDSPSLSQVSKSWKLKDIWTQSVMNALIK